MCYHRKLTLLLLAAAAGCYDFGSLSLKFNGDAGGGDMIVYPPSCRDGARNNDESDVDCGGSCAPCAIGKKCLFGKDCRDGVCSNNKCDFPTCTDMVKNGEETSVDCGGSSCPGCPVGKPCASGFDCMSTTCTNGVCAPSPCMNKKIDGDETDVDCGGGTCGKCGTGKMCVFAADCLSGQCVNNLCKSNCPLGSENCDGNAQNGCEVNTDNDAKNCGACGNVCPMATPFCTLGKCVPGQRLLVGSYNIGMGPMAGTNPVTFSCIEACAQVFGGKALDYGCSTNNIAYDGKAYYDGFNDSSHCQVNPLDEGFKMGLNYSCGVKSCAFSAFVFDHMECVNKSNWCYK